MKKLKVTTNIRAGGFCVGCGSPNHNRSVRRLGQPRIDALSKQAVASHFTRKRLLLAAEARRVAREGAAR